MCVSREQKKYHRYRDTRLNFHFSKFLFSEIKREKYDICRK